MISSSIGLRRWTTTRSFRYLSGHTMPMMPMPPAMLEELIAKEHETDKIWAKSAAALKILSQGQEPSTYLPFKNFKEHLTGRGFVDALQDESAMRTLSSCLTFPLTLAYAFNLIFRDSPRHDTKVLILGARAESSLPSVWWKDFLYINDRTARANIKMNGPGLQSNNTKTGVKKSSSVGDVTLNWKVFDSSTTYDMKELLEDTGKLAVPSVTVSNQFTTETTKLFHDRVDAMELLRWADVFVMYNPGIGSGPCGTQWEPTIRLLMQTRKPLVFTAFNSVDLDQDLAALDRISAEEDSQDVGEPLEFIFPPHENPFKSLRRTVDTHAPEGSEARIVSANQYIYALQSK